MKMGSLRAMFMNVTLGKLSIRCGPPIVKHGTRMDSTFPLDVIPSQSRCPRQPHPAIR